MAQRQPSRTSGFRRLSRAIDPVRMHLFAALAEKERALISTRIRQALSAAKTCGMVTPGSEWPARAAWMS
jgi:DNA invertase Pin-like site-specific DNA recombinase